MLYLLPLQVERRSAASLSCEEFYTQYALTHAPVVITDITMTAQPWTFDYIKQVSIQVASAHVD